jgi:chorismate mutase / prephenate dehydratase
MPIAHPTLEELRREIDRIDDSIHDLIIRRAEIVDRIGRIKRGSSGYLRPAREAKIVRRLIARHKGSYPRAAIARVWREIISAFTQAQGKFAIAVLASPEQPGYWDLARDQYGSLSPITAFPSAARVLHAVAEGEATVGVLPLPEPAESSPWWPRLLSDQTGTPRIIGKLPFAAGTPRAPNLGAFAVGLVPIEPSDADRSLIAIEAPIAMSLQRLTEALTLAGLTAIHLAGASERGGAGRRWHLVEVDGFIAEDSPKFAALRKAVGAVILLGCYPVPLPAHALASD